MKLFYLTGLNAMDTLYYGRDNDGRSKAYTTLFNLAIYNGIYWLSWPQSLFIGLTPENDFNVN